MMATDKLFAGSIPEIYDRFLVPLIFEPYAADLAGRVAMAQPCDVLETAAGTGVLTRALASRLAPSTRIVATDLNEPMLDQASRRQAGGNIEWKQADALALPFGDQSFDVVACQFGVMFFPDKVRGIHRGTPSAEAGRAFPFQCLGPHRGERIRRRGDGGAGGSISKGSTALPSAHAAWSP
jgi:SAM-dependent methyltransferase